MTKRYAGFYHASRRRERGFTLVEIMVSITVASILSLAVISTYSSQAGTYMTQGRSSQAVEDGREVYMVLNHLLRQAENSSIAITQNAGSTIVDFTVPSGYAIWPNTTAPYDRNAIRIAWSDSGTNANQITVASATSIGGLGGAQATALAGSNSGSNTRVIGLTMTALVPAGYTLSVTTRAGVTPPGQTATGTTFDGLVLPRN